MTINEYLSVSELEAYTGISASTWNKRRMTGDSPPWSTIGRTVRYKRSDVDAWLAASRRHSTSESVDFLRNAKGGVLTSKEVGNG